MANPAYDALNKSLAGHEASSFAKADEPEKRFDPFRHVALRSALDHHANEAETHFGQAVLATARGDQVHAAGRTKLYEHHAAMADRYRKEMVAHAKIGGKAMRLPAKSLQVPAHRPHPMDAKLDAEARAKEAGKV